MTVDRTGVEALTVHPHVCGEHTIRTVRSVIYIGSSPRMWGTFDEPFQILFCFRFIPTYVGNMCIYVQLAERTTVHPHVCGEHAGCVRLLMPDAGSSPRMWGTSDRDAGTGHQGRFIPTYVGNILHVICLHFTQETLSISFIDAGNPLK